jgi:hypothetical protein
MNTNGFKLICDVYINAVKNDHISSDTADVMFNIANAEEKSQTNNTFEQIGKFLVNYSEILEAKFEKDYNYGTASMIPSVPKFIWSEFMKYNRDESND